VRGEQGVVEVEVPGAYVTVQAVSSQRDVDLFHWMHMKPIRTNSLPRFQLPYWYAAILTVRGFL